MLEITRGRLADLSMGGSYWGRSCLRTVIRRSSKYSGA